MNRYLFLLLTFLVFACNKTETDPYQADMGYDYFPVATGKYRIYQVDSVIYKKSGPPDTFSCQIKETYVEKLPNGSWRLLREWRRTPADEWQINTVWSVRPETNRIIQTEENLSFVKLVFPVEENRTWDGNVFIDDGQLIRTGDENIEFFKEWNYAITGIGAWSAGALSFDSVATVTEADFETAIELRRSIARYAKGTGLVERVQWILDTQCITCTTPWEEKAEKGVILTQVLIDHN